MFREDELGNLEPSKFADLMVLDRDYLSVPEIEIRRIKPLLTMVGGEVVFEQPQQRSTGPAGSMAPGLDSDRGFGWAMTPGSNDGYRGRGYRLSR